MALLKHFCLISCFHFVGVSKAPGLKRLGNGTRNTYFAISQ